MCSSLGSRQKLHQRRYHFPDPDLRLRQAVAGVSPVALSSAVILYIFNYCNGIDSNIVLENIDRNVSFKKNQYLELGRFFWANRNPRFQFLLTKKRLQLDVIYSHFRSVVPERVRTENTGLIIRTSHILITGGQHQGAGALPSDYLFMRQ